MLKREGNENRPPAYLGRYIIIGTVVDTRDRHPVPHCIVPIVDMRDGKMLAEHTGDAHALLHDFLSS